MSAKPNPPLAELEQIAARLTACKPLSWRLTEDGSLVVVAGPDGRKLTFTPREVLAARALALQNNKEKP